MKKLYGSFCLLLTAVIWGFAFTAQAVGMEYVGPFTFLSVRSFVGSLALVPLLLVLRQKKEKKKPVNRRVLLKSSGVCGVILCVASALQQIGLQNTTVNKAGFITAMYVLVVPVLGLFLGQHVPRKTWFCILMALAGLYLLSMNGRFVLARGDAMCALSAIFFGVYILVVDHYIPDVDGVSLSALQFLVVGILSAIPMLIWENPTLAALIRAAVPILYAGILSSGIAYTLEIIGQRYTEPTTATLLMSLESVFSMIGGILILHQIPSHRELAGGLLIFTAAVLAQIPSHVFFAKKNGRRFL